MARPRQDGRSEEDDRLQSSDTGAVALDQEIGSVHKSGPATHPGAQVA
jgi:hypothetical protein